MKIGQVEHLERIEQELMDLYRQLEKEECSTDILLAACKVSSINTRELLGKYKPSSCPLSCSVGR